MANGTAEDLALGPGWLYVASVGTAEPVSASAALPSAWRPVGYTEDGSTPSTETTSEEILVAEELDPIRYENTKRVSMVQFQMAEATRRNLALGLNMGANAADDGTALEPPNLGDEVRVMLVWDFYASDHALFTTKNRRWLFRQCYQSGPIAPPRKKAPAKTLIAVNFRLEKPTGLAPFKVFPNADGVI